MTWDTLSDKQKDEQDLRMATYAAMIDCVDQNVGKIVDRLKSLNIYDNTLILFLHDNGGCDEGGVLGCWVVIKGREPVGQQNHLPIAVSAGRMYQIHHFRI